MFCCAVDCVRAVLLDALGAPDLAARRGGDRPGRHQHQVGDGQPVRAGDGRRDVVADARQLLRRLVAGAALAWARALGEFGATMIFAGSLPGSTMTLPLLIHRQLHGDAVLAVATSSAMLGISAVVLALVAAQGGGPGGQRAFPRRELASVRGGRPP